MDTLLIIAVKIDNSELVSLILGLDGVDATRKNGKGLDAMAVAKALGREHLLLGISTTSAADAVEPSVKGGGAAAAVAAAAAAAARDGDNVDVAAKLAALPPPPGKTAGEVAAGAEIAQLGYAVEMLKVINDLIPSNGIRSLPLRLAMISLPYDPAVK